MPAESAALTIRDLKFSYHNPGDSSRRDWIIDLPSLNIARGEQWLLTASSGRGKSTLLALIAGLMDPLQGAIEIAGIPLASLRGAARDRFRGRHVGMIFQTFNLLHGFSALENVMAALMFSDTPPGEHRAKAEALLKHLGIERVNAEPERLSVGQQQRVAVARALACDPVLVLADEPTASLDPANAAAAMDLIQSLCREKNAALLCVSHDPAMASRFERRQSLNGPPQTR